MKEIFVVLTAFVLCAGLMAGCSTAGSSAAASESPAVSAAVEAATAPEITEAPLATATAEEPAAAAAYSEDALDTALDACVSFEMDTAGGSLKAAQAAAGLVQFFAEQCTADDAVSLIADGAEWYDELDDDQRALLALNWPVIADTARSIAADPAGQADLLESAGVQTDFSALKLDSAAALTDALDSIFGSKQ